MIDRYKWIKFTIAYLLLLGIVIYS
ncbi:hypothetical protein LCGC14_2340550, partial [marine sediment metagenome]